nr:hypothetical protein CFP56_13839 [Quercus suber]POE67694.1 hypothetical protein CFP56_13842 [Quercus suber]
MYLDEFLEAFKVSNVTILFLLSLGVGLLPKLGGAIGLELDYYLSWVVQLDWSWTNLHILERMSFCWPELDWIILWRPEVMHLGWIGSF